MEAGVASAGAHQFVMRPVLDQASPLEGEDTVGATNRRKSVSDDDGRAPLADAPHVVLDDPLALVVQRACCFVEDQDAWVGNERACDCDSLPLPARQAAAAFTNQCVVAFGKLENKFMCAGKRCRMNDLIHRHSRVRERDIFAHGTIEQHVFLQDDADLTAQPSRIDHRKVDTIHKHATGFRHIEALDEFRERAFA